MLRYALNRLFWTIPVVLVAITIAFFLVRATGGSPFRHGPLIGLTGPGGWQKYGDAQPESIRDNMYRRYGLDLPWYEQYGNYVVGVATFSLGPSLSFRNRTVEDIIRTQGPITLELCGLALCVALLVGIPAGVVTALARGTPLAPVERLGSSLALSIPAFFVATLLIYVFSVRMHVLPTSGWDGWQAKLMPTLTLAIVPAAYCTRLMRGTILEALEHDYVRTAQSKGLRRQRVVTVHVLRNALVPVLSAVGPLLGAMITTVFVVEYVFGIPGLARNYVAAATADDYPLVLGMTVVLTISIIAANLLVDLAMAALDPRLRDPR